ncbi:hypothetical protein PB1_16094 [Bacillus methanolicus PB1]|uniref:Uncharacterized protein n=1 Tax=Bacillus methanolicus PB1 TaxID=997296 RepID=I3DXX3_BACMT|nr:hypothetical protein [Bacillus methanolicus]EIJ79094.1 hypothetical protein PB1_16094 [Bacillus methanolicus PB1]
MKIKLTVHLDIEGQKLMQSGSFSARREEDIPGIAYEWIQQIKRETGYRDTRIEKVIVDNEKDITEEVRAINKTPIPDIDFW